jgi:hypothetical protein
VVIFASSLQFLSHAFSLYKEVDKVDEDDIVVVVVVVVVVTAALGREKIGSEYPSHPWPHMNGQGRGNLIPYPTNEYS